MCWQGIKLSTSRTKSQDTRTELVLSNGATLFPHHEEPFNTVHTPTPQNTLYIKEATLTLQRMAAISCKSCQL